MLFIGIFDIEFIFLPTQCPSLLPGVFLRAHPSQSQMTRNVFGPGCDF